MEMVLIFLREPGITQIIGHEVMAVEGVLDVLDIAHAIVGVDPDAAFGVGPFFEAASAIVFMAGGGAIRASDGKEPSGFIVSGGAGISQGIDFHSDPVQGIILLPVEAAQLVAGGGFITVGIVGMLHVVSSRRVNLPQRASDIVVSALGIDRLEKRGT